MRMIAIAAVGFANLAAAQPLAAQEAAVFDIPAGRLDTALIRFARQSGLSVDAGNRELRGVRTQGLSGRHGTREGLRILLRGTGFDFRISGQGVITLARSRARAAQSPPSTAPRRPEPPPPPPPPLPPPPPPPMQIVVSATKQDARLSDYPGSIHVAQLNITDSLRFGGGGSELLLRELPNLTSTDLGAGRNKIFIRGVADSSFNGQTQATISQYLGESRLTYSAPDPNLLLYDIASLEVLEGPQGTLYGAGSLGGVIRISPRTPELGATSFAGSAAVSSTGGALGGELVAIANLPVSDNSAARVVAYGLHRPGYIDDLGRGLTDINQTDIRGLRASWLVEPSDRMEIELGVAMQSIGSRDGQYTDSGTRALTRHSAIAQPFDNDYLLFQGRVAADLGFADLTSTSSLALQAIDSQYDASALGLGSDTAYLEDRAISLFSHETRLSGSSLLLSSWVAGITVAKNVDRASRFLGPVAALEELSQVRSTTMDSALFGEATVGLWHTFSITGGGRISWIRQVDDIAIGPANLEPERVGLRLLPTAAISWTPTDGFLVFARYHAGYRPGAVQVTGAAATAQATRFESDEIATRELGMRFGANGDARFWGGALISYSRWDQIQADLVTSDGFPYVANLGAGLVRYSSIDLGWRPLDPLILKATVFISSSKLDRPTAAFAASAEGDLPNIADEGFNFSARLEPEIGETRLTLTGSVGYIGASFLAIGAPLELSQGRYFDSSLGARLELGDWGVSVDVENLLDTRGNRFSFGNPFEVSGGLQRTPLRPRTIRLGIDAQF